MARSVNMPSLFELFSYRKKRVFSIKDSYENERKPCSENGDDCSTPNRDHSIPRVSETPAESIRLSCSNTPISRNMREKRMRDLITSSSDENSEQMHHAPLPKPLFHDIPCSKRSKDSRSEKQNLAITTKEKCVGEDDSRTTLLANADTEMYTSKIDLVRRRRKIMEDIFSDEDLPPSTMATNDGGQMMEGAGHSQQNYSYCDMV